MRGTMLLFSQAGGRATVQQKSSLELRLHKLKFIGLLSEVSDFKEGTGQTIGK